MVFNYQKIAVKLVFNRNGLKSSLGIFAKSNSQQRIPKTAPVKDRTILLLVVIGLVIYGITRYAPSRRPPDFQADLIRTDSTAITSISITPPGGQPEIALRRTDARWIVSNGRMDLIARPEVVSGLLQTLAHIPTTRIATQDARQWMEYGVDERSAIRIRVYENRRLREDFFVGKTEILADTVRVSYLRLASAKEVYVIPEDLASRFALRFNDFRSNRLLQLPAAADVIGWEWQSPDTALYLQRTNAGWYLNDQPLDSLRVMGYLHSLQAVHGDTFADDFDEVLGAGLLFRTLIFHARNEPEAIVVQCYRDTLRTLPFIIHSRQYPEAYFACDSLGAYQTLFKEWTDFLPQRPQQ